MITDGPLLVISLFIAHQSQAIAPLTTSISLGGVLVLIWSPSTPGRPAPSIDSGHAVVSDTNDANSLTKSILTNLLNPHPYLFWLTVGGPTASKALAAGAWQLAGFIASFAVTIVGSKMLIATAIDHYRDQFRCRIYELTSRVLRSVFSPLPFNSQWMHGRDGRRSVRHSRSDYFVAHRVPSANR